MSRTAAVSLAAALSLAACGDPTTAPTPRTANPISISADVTTIPFAWASVVTGETGPGAQYALYMPPNWNGDVVYYAHGIVDPALDPSLPTANGIEALRDTLGGRGYAVAYSSFSETGWAVKDGAQRTHQLRGIFTSNFGKANRSYLMGHSMGGLIVQDLAEQHGSQYDGVLAMCAPLGGAVNEINYLGDVRAIFDVFYPGVVPGDVVTVPPGTDLNTVLAAAQAAILANPTPALGYMPRIAQTPLAGSNPFNPPEIIQSILTAIAYDLRVADDATARAHGHVFFDNNRDYTGALPASLLLQINAGVKRYTATPDAINYFEKYYTPSGSLSLPTVTLHTTRDPVVPIFHEAQFANAVTTNGSSSLLLQRTVNAYGHCNFSVTDMTSAFQALTSWVETGVKPAS
jgi:pimeloyl-ACP methyl ester carboxylesterase